ncbi:MAG: oxygen-independent coproporphyrinogen III oxidase [Clostridia bacterium]|nr:oxygen-independent coproporphyrinogen III oxidase [Clostridia bacterium]
MEQKELGIYVHIPFCKRKCYYCDFVSFSDKCDKIEKYIETLIKELNTYNFEKYNVTTIYIGGGTPSFIESKYIIKIIDEIKSKIKNNSTKFEDIEITLEVNPGTVNKEKLYEYRKNGINRLSIGLQSTSDRILKEIGRIHNYEDFLENYKNAKEVGFDNINVDLMLGLPNQSINDLKESLGKIIELNPNHISVYSLILEESTIIYQYVENGMMKLPSEELERQMYWYVKDTLELNGYKHYEISNFAKNGKESKHNLNCWEQKEYIGLGVAAHSYLDFKRYSNSQNLEEYIQDFTKKTIQEVQLKEDMKKEYMLLGLRKINGISITKFKEKFNDNPIYLFRKELEKLVDEELIIIDGDTIKLTNKGLDFANLVWEEFV